MPIALSSSQQLAAKAICRSMPIFRQADQARDRPEAKQPRLSKDCARDRPQGPSSGGGDQQARYLAPSKASASLSKSSASSSKLCTVPASRAVSASCRQCFARSRNMSLFNHERQMDARRLLFPIELLAAQSAETGPKSEFRPNEQGRVLCGLLRRRAPRMTRPA